MLGYGVDNTARSIRILAFVGSVVTCTCVAFAGVAVWTALHTRAWVQASTDAQGQVIALSPVVDQEGGQTNYAPIFRFTARDGQMYTITSNTSSNPPAFQVGERVSVLYQSDQPQHARINRFLQLWLLPLVFAILAFVECFVIAVIFSTIRKYRKRLRLTAA
jgi:hypothetical protein